MTVPQQKNIELKKHVSTIHCSNTLSLLQRKIANALLYHAYDDLLKKDEHEIAIRDLCLLIGYESHDYKTIKRALVDLLSTVIEWNIIAEGASEEEQHQWNASSIIADASIRAGRCSYSYSNKMKQLLYMPSIYGRLNMTIQAKFKSSYGLALYENAVRYQNLKQTPWFDMAIFRKLMGVSENTYLIFRDFKRRVLDKAIDEVNAFSPIHLTPQFKKAQRNVVAIRFDIQANDPVVAHAPNLEISTDDPLIVTLRDRFGCTEKQAQLITKKYSADYIFEKIKIIEASPSFKAGKILNLANYLLTALAENYQKPVMSTVAKSSATKKNSKDAITPIYNEQKHYSAFVTTYYQNVIAEMSAEQKTQIETNFTNYLAAKGSDFLLQLYRKDGLTSKFVAMEFRQFLRLQFPEKFIQLPTLEEYTQQMKLNSK